MAGRKYKTEVTSEEAKMIAHALSRGVKDLEKLESAVLNAGVRDAAQPVKAEITKHKQLQERFEEIYQPKLPIEPLPRDAMD